MSNVEKISISLPKEMVASMKEVVASGAYASTSEIMRDALRGWQADQQRKSEQLALLRKMVQDGIDSGPGEFDSIEELIAEARLGYTQRRKSA
jgi:antitoxin ParD1/3/4